MRAELHPSDVVLLALAAGTLNEVQHGAIEDHVRGCARCSAFASAMEHVGGIVLDSLPPTPLAEGSLIEVMARIDRLSAPVDLPALASRSHSGIASSYLHPAPLISSLDRARPARRVKTVLAGAALVVFSLGIIYLAGEYAFFRYVDDYPASTATTGQVPIGGSTTGTIETAGDADWFKVALASGKTYRFLLEGSDTGQGTLQYPVLRILDGVGQELHSDVGSIDGPGPGWTSVVTYSAPSSGTYHVSYEASAKNTGTYKISATEL